MLGCSNLLLATNHKPLVGVFAKNLEDIENPRLLSIAEKTMWFKFTTIHVPGKLNNGPDYMSRHSGEHIDTSHLSNSGGVEGANAYNYSAGPLLPAQEVMQVEEGILICKYFEVGRISTYGQQIDDALVASMRAALSHSEGLRAVTFDRVRGATRKDPELMRLMDALLTTHYRKKLPENLERFERYR